jgi:hypothetical protein
MKRFSEAGSSPLELVTFTALLLLPLGLGLSVYTQVSHELAAESIARHALRLAMLENPVRPSQEFSRTIELFAQNWDVEVTDYRYWCTLSCSLVTLEVSVGNASAIQTMGLPKT